MNKRTIAVVLLLVTIIGALLIFFNWITVRNTIVQALKKQIRKDFLAQFSFDSGEKPQNKLDKFSFAVISDIHNNTDNLNKAVTEINKSSALFTVGLGDYTNVGTTEEFIPIKTSLAKLSNPYYLLPGDHDLWNGRDKTEDPKIYFNQTFSKSPEDRVYEGVQFLFLDNSDIYKGITHEELEKFKHDLADSQTPVIIISSHKAIYHPLTIHRMGYVNDKKNDEVLSQADQLWNLILTKKDAKVILLSGDLHSFGKYTLSSDKYEGYTIGALTKDKNFQTPRYAIVHVHIDNTVSVEDKELAQ